jgi:transcriptional regulator with XRE-family HTH domain
MDYDKNYIECSYTAEELEKIFIKEFAKFRRENNLTQDLFSKYSGVPREKIARIEAGMHSPSINSLLKILGPIGYTIKIEKVTKK